jgi:type VI protein secretion system component Hcp
MNKRITVAAVGAAALASAFGTALTVLGGTGDAAAKSPHARHAANRGPAASRAPAAVSRAAAPPVKTAFMTMSGITGAVTNAKFPGAVAVVNDNFGATSTPPTSGVGAGKTVFKDLTVTYQADRSLPQVEHDVFGGIHLATVSLSEVDPAGNPLRTITLSTATPDGVQTSMTAPGQSQVTVSFAYNQIQETEFVSPDSATPTQVSTCWNVATNIGC